MKVTPDVFAHLTHYLKGLANGKVMVLLEVRIFALIRLDRTKALDALRAATA